MKLKFKRLLAELNDVSGISAKEGAQRIVICIAVSRWTGALEHSCIVEWPGIWLTCFWIIELSSAAIKICLEAFACAQAGYNLTVRVLFLQIAWANSVQILGAACVLAPILVA